VDSSATHNFMREDVARRFGLQIVPVHFSFKSGNYKYRRVFKLVRDVLVQIECWSQKLDFTIIQLEDYEII